MTLIIQKPTNGKLVFAKSYVSPLWTPAQVSTALWLDAADASTVTTVGGAVSQWNDKSGNARNATQSSASIRPAYTSNSIVFTADTLSVPIAAAQTIDRSLIAVLKTTSTNSAISAGFISLQAADNPELRYGAQGGTSTAGNGIYAYWNAGYAINGFNAALTTDVCVFASELNGITTPLRIELFKNGTSLTSATRNIVTLGTFSQFTLGGYTGLGTQDGSLNELIVYPTSATNRQLLEGYLAHKWGLAANLPSGHPYKSAAPTI